MYSTFVVPTDGPQLKLMLFEAELPHRAADAGATCSQATLADMTTILVIYPDSDAFLHSRAAVHMQMENYQVLLRCKPFQLKNIARYLQRNPAQSPILGCQSLRLRRLPAHGQFMADLCPCILRR